jgi:hypothetical protein
LRKFALVVRLLSITEALYNFDLNREKTCSKILCSDDSTIQVGELFLDSSNLLFVKKIIIDTESKYTGSLNQQHSHQGAFE